MFLWDKLPFLLIIIILLLCFVMPFFARWKPVVCPYLTVVTVIIVFVISVVLTFRVAGGEVIHYHAGDWPPPWGIEIFIDELRRPIDRSHSSCLLASQKMLYIIKVSAVR